jgi:hypothetical protein
MRMMRDGVEIYTTGILTREVIAEITTDFDSDDARRTDGYIQSRITVSQ